MITQSYKKNLLLLCFVQYFLVSRCSILTKTTFFTRKRKNMHEYSIFIGKKTIGKVSRMYRDDIGKVSE